MPRTDFYLDDFDIEFIETVKEAVLDEYLAKGWYRMGALMHITNTVGANGKILPVKWIRYDVDAVALNRSKRKILDKNKNFTVTIKPYRTTKQLEQLFIKYFVSITFDMCPDLEDATNDPECKIFDTYVIQIKDGSKLIAAGIFDIGKESVAAIRNFYDPEYKKHSLGKYLMLLTYQYCLTHGIKWFYPGYIIPGYPKFDYKLFLDKQATEIYSVKDKKWMAYLQIVNS